MIISAIQQSGSVIRVHAFILFQSLFPQRPSQNIGSSSLSYISGIHRPIIPYTTVHLFFNCSIGSFAERKHIRTTEGNLGLLLWSSNISPVFFPQTLIEQAHKGDMFTGPGSWKTLTDNKHSPLRAGTGSASLSGLKVYISPHLVIACRLKLAIAEVSAKQKVAKYSNSALVVIVMVLGEPVY